jgi:capsular polysaccharide biosynthesis protein
MEEEMTLDIRELFYMIKKRMKLIIIITLACTLASGILSYFVLKPVYEAKASIIVGKPQGTDNTQTQYSDVQMYQKLVTTYSEIAKSSSVAEKTAVMLNGRYTSDQIMKAVTVTAQTDTQILVISAQSGDPQEAVNIANAVSNAFIEESKTVFPTGGDIQIMDNPKLPNAAVKPNKKLNLAIAFLIGIMASVGLTFVLEYLDKSIKTEEDVARWLDIPVIGIIPRQV